MTRSICPICGSLTALGNKKCFKCNYRVKYSKLDYKYEETTYTASSYDLYIPKNIITKPTQFHPDALEWLYKHYIYNQAIQDFCIGYLPDEHRVFLPGFDKNLDVMFYQTRALYKNDLVKYKTFGSNFNQHCLFHNFEDSKRLIIVEDLLSSYRLSKQENVLCMTGTHISDDVIKDLLKTFDNIVFWTDADQPGIDSRNKLYNKFNQSNLKHIEKVAWITSKTHIEIQEYLRNSCGIFNVPYKITNHYKNNNFYFINNKNIKLDPKCYTDCDITYILNNEVILCKDY